MNTLFIVIALAILLIAVVLRAATRPGKTARPKGSQLTTSSAGRKDRSSTQWRAVKIAPGLISCGAAGKLADKVFLSSESPRLPLDGCSEQDCRCKYVHLDDRREGGDRRIELGELSAFLPISQTERRQMSGRRREDLAA